MFNKIIVDFIKLRWFAISSSEKWTRIEYYTSEWKYIIVGMQY